MSVAYTITFTLRRGQRERFLRLLTEVMEAMRHEATYRGATLHEDPGDPARFLLHDIWADHEDVVNVQIHRPYRQAWHEALPDLLQGERRIEIWRPIDA
ncbi:antibiotic biosynthesis monooxygenase [Methylobacterium terricola]|uniref:Antibiotic biosynthesis monooxygenase n=1 Tax=Methylobacterium terricola TaxID=2583531 RepID=A0A5C4LDT9_9HYPH|nr:putative quinol monooxygenase [Methylobacterium terricola]TNC10719.1 antibiotic biosynthesis monooxygenase [Methylobacterium terricola]